MPIWEAGCTSSAWRARERASPAAIGQCWAHRAHGHVFFLFGFAKNARATISSRETRALAAWGDVLAELDAEQLATALRAGELQVLDDDQDS